MRTYFIVTPIALPPLRGKVTCRVAASRMGGCLARLESAKLFRRIETVGSGFRHSKSASRGSPQPEVRAALVIARGLFLSMLASIDLDDQTRFRTKEIDDVGADLL